MTRASRSRAVVAPAMCSVGSSKGAAMGMAGMAGTNCAGGLLLPRALTACIAITHVHAACLCQSSACPQASAGVCSCMQEA